MKEERRREGGEREEEKETGERRRREKKKYKGREIRKERGDKPKAGSRCLRTRFNLSALLRSESFLNPRTQEVR